MTVDTDALLAAINPEARTIGDWIKDAATAREGVLLAAGVLDRHRADGSFVACMDCSMARDCRDRRAALAYLTGVAQRYGVPL